MGDQGADPGGGQSRPSPARPPGVRPEHPVAATIAAAENCGPGSGCRTGAGTLDQIAAVVGGRAVQRRFERRPVSADPWTSSRARSASVIVGRFVCAAAANRAATRRVPPAVRARSHAPRVPLLPPALSVAGRRCPETAIRPPRGRGFPTPRRRGRRTGQSGRSIRRCGSPRHDAVSGAAFRRWCPARGCTGRTRPAVAHPRTG